MSPIRLSILRRVEEHTTITGQSADALGRAALGDHKAVARLRAGRNITLGRCETLLDYMDAERTRTAVGTLSAAA
jgi:hypothetical protein